MKIEVVRFRGYLVGDFKQTMHSNGKFVNNCKSLGPMRIRQHTLSPSCWPTPHLSFSYLFFFFFLFLPLFFTFRFLLISLHHISSFSLKENHKPKQQTQFSSSKKIQHHRLENKNPDFLISLPFVHRIHYFFRSVMRMGSWFFFFNKRLWFFFPRFGWQPH